MSSQLQVTGEAKIRDIQGPVVANSGVITALDGAASQYVRGDGTLADFPTSSGGGSSVSYYLNSSVSQGTIGGVAYRELSKEPIIGAGTDIAISTTGYVASYITDVNDPDVILIPGGNFNCEFYFSVNNNTGNPFFYAELYKYDGTTFTLLGSSVGVPEYITQGTVINPYYFAIPVATAALALTDRLAIRIYVNVGGRTITLHTENGHLCQVVTTLSKGMVSLNNLTDQSQFITTGTSGTNFNIVSSGDTHTFNLPVASAANTGKLSSSDWSVFNAKEPAITAGTTLQYYRGDKTFQTLDTTAVIEATNLYFTDARARAALSAGTGISYNNTTGVITSTITQYTDALARAAISLTTTGSSGDATYNNTTGVFNIPNYGSALTGYVPYTGATTNVNLGVNSLTATGITISKSSGIATLNFPIGTNDPAFIQHDESTANTAIMRFSVSDDDAPNDYFVFGNVNSAGGGSYVERFRITANGIVNLGTWQGSAIADAYISSASTWNAKQNAITLTTTGTSGAATFIGSTLNIPNYGSALSGYLPLSGGTLTGTLNGTSAVFSSTMQASAYRLSGMTAGSGALYWTSDRVTLANYNATGVVHIEANGGAGVATFGGSTFNNDFVGTGRFTGALTGTSASFSSNVAIGGATSPPTAGLKVAGDIISENGIGVSNVEGGVAANYYTTYSGGGTPLGFIYGSGGVIWSNGGTKMSLTSAGALQLVGGLSATTGTFSSSVTATSESSLFKEGYIIKASTTSGGGSQPAYTYYTAAGSKRWSSFLNVGDDKFHIANASNSELFTIQQNGNVGIGTNVPSTKLEVNGSGSANSIMTYPCAKFYGGGSGGINIGTDGTYAMIATDTSGADMQLLTRVAGVFYPRMTITSGGNVLIGTTSSFTSGLVCIDGGTSYIAIATKVGTTSGAYHLIFNNPNGSVGSIATSGSSTAYNTSSDYRLKQNLKDYNGLDLVSAIKTYDYEWKSDNTRAYGVMAHELSEVIPYAVYGEKDGKEMQGVDYSKLVPILVKAIQEQQAQIEELSNKIVALESK